MHNCIDNLEVFEMVSPGISSSFPVALRSRQNPAGDLSAGLSRPFAAAHGLRLRGPLPGPLGNAILGQRKEANCALTEGKA